MRTLLILFALFFSLTAFSQNHEEEDEQFYINEILSGDIPVFGSDSLENARLLTDFCNRQLLRHDTRDEHYALLINIIGNSGVSIESCPALPSLLYRIAMSGYLGHLLFMYMGGKDTNQYGQMWSALRVSVVESLNVYSQRQPELFCAQIDSAASALRRHDYLGDIYPNDSLASRSVQDSLVGVIVPTLDILKDGIRRGARASSLVRSLMLDIRSNAPKIAPERYFTLAMRKKIESGEFAVDSISPRAEWKDWNIDDEKQFLFAFETNETFFVALNYVGTKGVLPRLFRLTFAEEDGRILISDYQKVESSFDFSESDLEFEDNNAVNLETDDEVEVVNLD